MPKIAEREQRLGSVVQYESKLEYGRSRKVIEVTEATEVKYEIGRVIGDDFDTFQDGDEFVGVYVGSPEGDDFQTIPAATATKVVVVYREAGFGDKNLVFGATVNDETKRQAALAKIEATGDNQIFVQP